MEIVGIGHNLLVKTGFVAIVIDQIGCRPIPIDDILQEESLLAAIERHPDTIVASCDPLRAPHNSPPEPGGLEFLSPQSREAVRLTVFGDRGSS